MKLIIALVVPTANPQNETSDEQLITEARALFNKLNKITARRIIAEKRNEIEKEMAKLELHLTKTNNTLAQYYICKAADLHAIIYKTPIDRKPYLEKMLHLIEHEGLTISEREKALTCFKIADNLCEENKIEEAHNYIYNLYLTNANSFKGLLSGYHLLITTSILLKKYSLAEEVLNKEFHEAITGQHEPFCSFAHLNYAILYLHWGDYEKAIAQIIELKNVAGKTQNAMQEAKVRLLETIYFFLTGDIDYASQLIPINNAFFNSSKVLERSQQIKQAISIIVDCIDAVQNKKELPQKTKHALEQYNIGNNAIYGELLLRMAAMLRTTKR